MAEEFDAENWLGMEIGRIRAELDEISQVATGETKAALTDVDARLETIDGTLERRTRMIAILQERLALAESSAKLAEDRNAREKNIRAGRIAKLEELLALTQAHCENKNDLVRSLHASRPGKIVLRLGRFALVKLRAP